MMPQLFTSLFTTRKCCFLKSSSIIAAFLLLSIVSNAKDYYFSNSTGNDSYTSTQAQNQATPWKSIAKLNSFFNSIVAGDNIYFKRGDTFYGAIVVTKSGTSGNLITIGAYGTGNKPIITGLITLSSWSLVSNGIYQASAPTVKSTVNLLTLNGTPQGVGRYPNLDAANGGYLTYEGNTASTITDNQLTGATNWTGAEVVIRKQHYVLERCKVTSQVGTLVSYASLPSIDILNNPTSTPVAGANGFGYFFQRDVRTLDQLGEWYFNNATKNMQVFFGSNNPSAYTVQVSTLDTLINIGTKNYINVNNISFEGANNFAVYAANAGNLTIKACDMNLMGAKGILVFNSPNILIDGVTTTNALCNAIDVTSRHVNNITITNCVVKNTGMIAGMGSFWDGNDYKGISVTVNSGALVQYNSIQYNGFVGIEFQGNNVTIKNNFINYYDMVKDDGGGIYTWQDGTDAAPGTIYTNRSIDGNIIMNGVGAAAGTAGNIDVDGIFLDGRTTNVNVVNNTMANIGVNGIYTNNSNNVNIIGNTSFNNGSCVGITRYSWGSTTNLTIKNNVFFPKLASQNNFNYVNTGINVPVVSTIQTAMQNIGYIDSNYYSTPNATGFGYYYSLVEGGAWTFPKPISFGGWKSFTNHDLSTKLPPKTIPSYSLNSLTTTNIVTNGTFTSNTTGITIEAGNNLSVWDGTSKITGTGSLKVTPILPSTNFTLVRGTIGAVSSAKQYILRFTTLGTANSGVLNAYIRQSAAPYTKLTPVQSDTYGATKVIHEYLFTAPTTNAAASFAIEIQQSSGTTYIDDIAFYEATATVLNIDDQLRFEYNASTVAKTVTLNANYLGVDNTAYNGTITLQPYTAKVLLYNGPVTAGAPPPPSSLVAAAVTPAISCFGATTTATVTGSGGTAPYTGTGAFTINAGKGTLKIAVAVPVARAVTSLYSAVGAISSAKSYLLTFSTLGTTSNGSLTASIKQTNLPWAYIAPKQTRTFGTTRVDHQFIFTAPTTEATASFIIEILQTSGTTYIDNIAFFEATSAGIPTSKNLYSSGQFESSISGITTWSLINNHTASLDLTSKISNIYYYPVIDSKGLVAVATAATTQPAAGLYATATAGTVPNTGGTTTVVVAAIGGTAPYTGTGSFANVKVGTYTYTVTDAKGCAYAATVTVKQASGARVATTGDSLVSAESLNSVNSEEALTASGPLTITTYPNPTIAEFNLALQGGSSDMVNIIVSGIDGRVVYKAQGTSNKKYTFGSNLIPGMYFIQVIQGKSVQTLKVVKTK